MPEYVFTGLRQPRSTGLDISTEITTALLCSIIFTCVINSKVGEKRLVNEFYRSRKEANGYELVTSRHSWMSYERPERRSLSFSTFEHDD